jgi:K+ potassium transporter C-terminal domain
MPRWQELLFIRLSRSASDATDYFQIPTGRVVEVGTQVTIQGANPTGSAYIVAGRQQLHCFLGGTEHRTPHAFRFGSVS